MTTRAKALWLNILFHFVFLGLIVRPLFYPDMPHVYWLGLLAMFAFMNPIIAYFYGWEMNLRGHVPADAPKIQRFSLLLLLMAAYALGLLKWLGVIGQVGASS